MPPAWADTVCVGCGPSLVTQGRARLVEASPQRMLYRGLRWRMTTSSVPAPAPVLVPVGCPVSYGFCWVGQPTKCCELYSNHSDAVVTGITGRLAATKLWIGARSAVCCATVESPTSFDSAASIAGFLSPS